MFPLKTPGLGTRISLAFALGGLLLSTFLAFATQTLTREVLLRQRENAALSLALGNAQLAQSQITDDTEAEGVDDILSALQSSSSRPLVQLNGVWQGDGSGAFTQEDVPVELLTLVASGQPGRIRIALNDQLTLIHGIPLPEDNADYFEAASLAETESNLRSLQLVLIGAALTSTLLAALLGKYASRRMLEPLNEVSDAAVAIAGGRLDTRLDLQVAPELTSLANSFNDMAGALETRIDRDARFASEVSHELRSPLMTLAASVEVLENNLDQMPDRAATAVELLSSDVTRFQTLVQDLLEISRFDAGDAVLELEPVGIGEFVRQVARRSTESELATSIAPTAEEAIVDVDKRRLAQVMANLIENARKYGGGATRIDVFATADTATIAVEDAGPGVPLAEREVIFDRFSRGSAGGSRGIDTGVGLGLSLVDEHVRLHNGRVWVEDRPDGLSGARFVVELPVSDGEADGSWDEEGI